MRIGALTSFHLNESFLFHLKVIILKNATVTYADCQRIWCVVAVPASAVPAGNNYFPPTPGLSHVTASPCCLQPTTNIHRSKVCNAF